MQRDLVDLLRCPLTGGHLQLEVHEADGDEVERGVLRGPVEDFPIVFGVAVLRGGDQEVVAQLRAGDGSTAEAVAVTRDLPLSRVDDVLPALESNRFTRSLARRLSGSARARAIERARGTLLAARIQPDPLLRMAMVENRRPNPEGYRYFRYRLGLPRHLVALGCLTAARPGPEPVVEIGCGAGHMTWQIAELFAPRPVVALERELYLLWVARRFFVPPQVALVCGDVRSLPLADRACSLGVAVDVLSFVSEKASAVRELNRVVGRDGGLVLTSLINADADHEFRGEPLTAGGWERLVGDCDHAGYDDSLLLDRYLHGEGPPSGQGGLDGRPRTLTLLAGPAALGSLGKPFDDWPHAIGRLAPHPLLRPIPRTPDHVHLDLVAPSEGFARDNRDVSRYLPDHIEIPSSVIEDARNGRRTADVEALIVQAVFLGYPRQFAPDPWARVEGVVSPEAG